MSNDRQRYPCDRHGRATIAFVCQHLAQGSGVGFFCSSVRPYPSAWCAECDALVQQTGEWAAEVKQFAGFTPVCERCYVAIRRRNRPRHRLLRCYLLALILAAVLSWLFDSFLVPAWRGERTLKGHTRTVACLTFAPDGSRLFSGGYDGKVLAWDLRTLEPEVLIELSPHLVTGLAVSPENTYLVVACDFDRTEVCRDWNKGSPNGIRALVVDLRSRTRVAELRSPLDEIVGLAFVPARSELIAADRFGRLTTWDIRTWALKRNMHDSDRWTTSFAMSADGSLLALEHEEQVRLFDAGWRPVGLGLSKPPWKGRGLAFAPDGQTLAFARRGNVALADPRSRAVAHLLPNPEIVTTIAYSPDGRLVAAGSLKWGAFMMTSGRLRVWRTDSGKEILSRKRSNVVTAVAFSPNGERLAVADGGGSILLLPTRGW